MFFFQNRTAQSQTDDVYGTFKAMDLLADRESIVSRGMSGLMVSKTNCVKCVPALSMAAQFLN